MGVLYTFYSYKGGVGRSMALANVAALLSSWGHSVLAIDWDLEAPGLEKYFMNEPSLVDGSRKKKPGIVDLVTAFDNNRPLNWEECLLHAYPFGRHGNRFEIISAGQDTREYVPKLQSIQWPALFEKGFGAYLEQLRDEWLLKYDFVLVDSRTGITDIGGVCTIHLPDVLVVLFTANEQSLDGVLDVVERANAKFSKLPDEYERPPKLLCVPVPSRFEYFTEHKSAKLWLKTFAERLDPIYAEWLPPGVTSEAVLQKLFVPNIPFWSFGEGLPVVQEGTSNPRSLGFAFELLAKVLRHRLQWNDVMRGEEAITEDTPPEVVNQEAERALSALPGEYAELAPRLLRQMVLVAPDSKRDARRRVALSDFNEKEQAVIKALVDTRLLSVTHDDDEEIVEIARDATLRNWERLRKWVDNDREFLLWRQKLQANISEWNHAKQEPTLLLNLSALEAAKKFEQGSSELTPEERDFINRSHQQHVQIYRRARLIRTVVALAVTLAVIIGGIYLYKSQLDARALSAAVLSTSRGVEKSALRDYPGAIQDYNEALAIKDDYDLAYLNRGEAYLNLANSYPDTDQGDRYRSQAIEDFEKAATITTDAETRTKSQDFVQAARNRIVPVQDPSPNYSPSPYPSPSSGTSPRPSPGASPTASAQASPILDLAPRVYLQLANDPESVRVGNDVARRLRAMGYLVFAPSYLTQLPRVAEIRYYRKSDAIEAAEIAAALPFKSELKYLVGFENSPRVRPRHFEIWLTPPSPRAN